MAESNRKCSRLGEWFVQEEIARAIDTALETIIGLSKRKQFKYHGGESLFALDFHTERHTSSLPPLVFSPLFILEGRVDTGIASLSSKSLLPCARRMISKWFVCTETHKAELTSVCVCVFLQAREFIILPGNMKFWGGIFTNRTSSLQSSKFYSLNQLFFLFYQAAELNFLLSFVHVMNGRTVSPLMMMILIMFSPNHKRNSPINQNDVQEMCSQTRLSDVPISPIHANSSPLIWPLSPAIFTSCTDNFRPYFLDLKIQTHSANIKFTYQTPLKAAQNTSWMFLHERGAKLNV